MGGELPSSSLFFLFLTTIYNSINGRVKENKEKNKEK
jgi:hypothetical protein